MPYDTWPRPERLGFKAPQPRPSPLAVERMTNKSSSPVPQLVRLPCTVRSAEARRAAYVSGSSAGGVSGQQHGFVPLDREGEVIRPAKLWCDTATAVECEEITEQLGGLKKTIRALGNAVLPGFTASKILWLKKHEPKQYARLATVLLPHDYLNFWLTGRSVMEYGDASGTALLDVRKRKWCGPAVEAIDAELPDKLPPLMPSDQPCGAQPPAARPGVGQSAGQRTIHSTGPVPLTRPGGRDRLRLRWRH